MNPAHEHEWMVPGRHFGQMKSLGLLAGVAIFFAAAGLLPAQQAAARPEPGTRPSSSAPAPPAQASRIDARLYVASSVDTGEAVDVAALRSEFRQAGIPVVEGIGAATSLLNVWRDDLGFHGALTDVQGAALWSGTARSESELAQDVRGYLRTHPQHAAAVNPPAQAMMASRQTTVAPEAPEFSLKADNGQRYSLESLKGKVVLLFFWASWCPVCRGSVPSVVDLSKKFAGTSFTIIGISVDSNKGDWRRYYREHQMDWPQYLDRDHRMSQIFKVRGIPTFFLLNHNGGIVFQQSGWGDPMRDLLAQMIEARLTGTNPHAERSLPAYSSAPVLRPQLVRRPIDPSSIPSGPMPIMDQSPAPAARPAESPGDGITAPEVVYEPEPPYTKAARKNGIEGTLTLQIAVNELGKVTDVREVGAHLGYGLDENAIATVRTWRFKPATRRGAPVAVRISVVVTFRLDEGP